MKEFMICVMVALLGWLFSACSHNEPAEKKGLIDVDYPIYSLVTSIELYDAVGNNLLSKNNPDNWLDRDIFVKFDDGFEAKFELKDGVEDIACPLHGRPYFGYIITQCYDYVYGPAEEYGIYQNIERFLRRNADDYALYIPPDSSGEENFTISIDSPDGPLVSLSVELIDGEKDAKDYNGNNLYGKECIVTECSVPYEMSYRAGERISGFPGIITFASIKLTLP